MRTIYECELCGQDFEDYKECIEHETAHTKPIHLSGAMPVGYRNIAEDAAQYPSNLHVKMSNGAVVSYRFAEIIDHGDEKCEETEEVGKPC